MRYEALRSANYDVAAVVCVTSDKSLDRAIEAIVDWYDAYRDGRDLRPVTFEQIESFGR